MPTVTIAITSGTRWRVPVDCTSATIEVIGGGSAGGGAYSKTNTVALTPLSFAYISVGAGANSGTAGDTWFNKTTNAAPSSTTNGALAKGGASIPNCVDGAALGGSSVTGVGDTKYSGGNGYGIYVCDFESYYNLYSFGGAAGPNGNGGNGYQASARGGGGGANGGDSSTSSTGGNNRLGSGGGAGGNPPTAGTNGGGGGANTVSGAGAQGGADLVFTDYLGNTYGPAGGGGGIGTSVNNLPAGVNYGGGGNPGGQGLIIVTYTPVVTIGNSYTEVLNEFGSTDVSTPSRWRIPYGVDTVTVHAIGSGSNGSVSSVNGGGGGAYATSVIDVSTLNNTGAYYLNYFNTSLDGNSDAWFNKSGSSAPSSSSNGVLAKGAGYPGTSGGQSASSVGTTTYSGGNGGTGSGTTVLKWAGGGGSAGPSGAGKNGGNSFAGNSSASSGGGGGSNGGSSTAGGNATSSTVAGAGGAGNSGSGGGAAATASSAAGNGSNGGGGGGGKNTVGFLNGGNGSTQNIWTDSGTSNQYGPGGGAGGSAATSSVNAGFPGTAGNWGGGRGYRYPALHLPPGYPLIVLQYTITKAAPVDGSTIVETASGSDSVLASLLYDRSVSETASGADSVSAALAYFRSIAEAASGSDEELANLLFLGLVSEAASGNDLFDGTVFNPDILSADQLLIKLRSFTERRRF